MKNFKCLWKFLFVYLLLCFSQNFLTLKSNAQTQTINYQFNWGENVQTYQQKVEVGCATFGCNSDQLIRVMNCESGQNSNAINRREPGQPSGLFQYKFQTWSNFSQKAGIPGANIWDPNAQIYTTTWAFSNGLSSHWACK